jgi:chitin disaccharide deacetylase
MLAVLDSRGARRSRPKVTIAVLTVCVLAGIVALERGFPPPEEHFVVIHSDDAGMYRSVNQATIDAMERGIVSSCSILVPCPAFEEFARYAAQCDKDFGIHLDLNCEKETDRWGPVLGGARVPSLVDAEGFFWRHTEDIARHAKIEEVEAELRAQIERCRGAGVRLSHLDHHMFVLYKRPDFLRLYVRLGLEYDLPIRYSAMPAPDDLDPSNSALVTAYREGLATLQSRGMPVFASIDTDNYQISAADKRRYYFDLFRKLGPGVSEILIHCAYGPAGPLHAPGVERREADTRVFMSQDTADELRRRGIRIITWRDFREMLAHKRRARTEFVASATKRH